MLHPLLAVTLIGGAVDHLWDHWGDVLTGATAVGIVAHAVNSFPTPTNKYGSWLLGVIQFAVGQRYVGQNTIQGQQSKVYNMGPPNGEK